MKLARLLVLISSLLQLASAPAFASAKYSYKFKMTCRGTTANGKSSKTQLFDNGTYCGEIIQENRFSATSKAKLTAECKTKFARVGASEWNDFKFQKAQVNECAAVPQ